ncbi:TadE/TadG family type IV pilus assembly protein [Rhizobium oryziradicis]|uniref:Pilus assembly protein TadG n=1 Tax=Rhizobium oryziradicis TaxID=1867956 RepID=A0A1Q8ZTA2_9HYPH|nr:TadE/TadG family type IV pilus assembly protein [Rhizobium oryziradicis]OLP45272.1 pilus assembly protein TadG [Rhizobium oryziradicis]
MTFIKRASDSRSRPRRYTWLRLLRRFRRSADGSAAIEFAILAIPYFLIVFAILETFIAFVAEQVVTSAVDTLGRNLRTGNITYNLEKSTNKTSAEFRQLFCNEISFLLKCDASEIATPNRLYLDVRSFSTFAAIPKVVTTANGSLDTTGFAYAPGGPGTINMLRAYYYWPVTTDLVRSYVATIRKPGETSNSDYLIVETTAFQSENY